MCCENCKLEQTDPVLYELRTSWLAHGQWEEFYMKQEKWYMFDYHKNERLKLEKKLRKYKKAA